MSHKSDAASVGTDVPYTLTRLGTIMAPEPGNPLEVEGVLNPATAWGDNGELYIYPRLVAAGNRSVVGIGEVVMEDGVPVGVDRKGVVLEADRGWEHGTDHGGVEDPRITEIPSLGYKVMTYVAYGPLGPKPAIAVSKDGLNWDRLGPIQFAYDDALDTDLNLFSNKDVVFFPVPVPGPNGKPAYGMIHRPMWDFAFTRPSEQPPLPAGITDDRASIWISYIDVDAAQHDITALVRPFGHRFVAGPEFDWEELKIGAGPAPIEVPEGWLLLHHGVTGTMTDGGFVPQNNVFYAAGGMILSADDPSVVLARTAEPLMAPSTADETEGTVGNVVFPTAIEVIDGTTYVFYGMADSKIGVARLDRV